MITYCLSLNHLEQTLLVVFIENDTHSSSLCSSSSASPVNICVYILEITKFSKFIQVQVKLPKNVFWISSFSKVAVGYVDLIFLSNFAKGSMCSQ